MSPSTILPTYIREDLYNMGLDYYFAFIGNNFIITCNDIDIFTFYVHPNYPIWETMILDTIKKAIQKEIDP